MNCSKSSRYEKFLALYSVNQKRIFGYILSLVPKRVDAEDILQQTAMEMWRIFDRFEEGSDFAAWGMALARFRVLKFRKAKQTGKFISYLSDEAFQIILDESAKFENPSSFHLPALEGCIKRLGERERDLLIQRYEKGLTYQSMAEKMDCSIALIYRNLTAIHTNLLRCIRRTVSMWDMP